MRAVMHRSERLHNSVVVIRSMDGTLVVGIRIAPAANTKVLPAIPPGIPMLNTRLQPASHETWPQNLAGPKIVITSSGTTRRPLRVGRRGLQEILALIRTATVILIQGLIGIGANTWGL